MELGGKFGTNSVTPANSFRYLGASACLIVLALMAAPLWNILATTPGSSRTESTMAVAMLGLYSAIVWLPLLVMGICSWDKSTKTQRVASVLPSLLLGTAFAYCFWIVP